MLCINQPQTFYDFSNDARQVINTLQEGLMFSQILGLPCVDGQYTVDTNEWDREVGTFLLQSKPDGPQKQIGYSGRNCAHQQNVQRAQTNEIACSLMGTCASMPLSQRKPIHCLHESLRLTIDI